MTTTTGAIQPTAVAGWAAFNSESLRRFQETQAQYTEKFASHVAAIIRELGDVGPPDEKVEVHAAPVWKAAVMRTVAQRIAARAEKLPDTG